jgi:hypothetical protein
MAGRCPSSHPWVIDIVWAILRHTAVAQHRESPQTDMKSGQPCEAVSMGCIVYTLIALMLTPLLTPDPWPDRDGTASEIGPVLGLWHARK